MLRINPEHAMRRGAAEAGSERRLDYSGEAEAIDYLVGLLFVGNMILDV